MQIKILSSSNPSLIEEQINLLLKDGWKLKDELKINKVVKSYVSMYDASSLTYTQILTKGQ